MSTPSDTMRTATIQGSVPLANRAMRDEAMGSSDTATVTATPNRRSMRRAIPCAWSWSMAMTRPPAVGWVRRIDISRRCASPSTVGSHSPSSDSAVRSRWLASCVVRSSSKVADTSAPSGATHSMWPPVRGK